MTNGELEQKVKRLEEQLTELRIELLERKAEPIPYKPYEVEVPEDIETYYTINTRGELQTLVYYTKFMQEQLYKRGEAFETKKEAEQFDKERILLIKLHKWAEEHNGGWTPDWENEDERKYFIEYDSRFESLGFDSHQMFNPFSKLPYFKSEEIGEKFIKEFGDEIKEVLC